MQCCFHDKKKLPYRVKWGVFTFYVRCVIALKTNDNTSPQPRTVLLEVEQYKHLLNCHYVIQRNRGILGEYCINMRSLRHICTSILIQFRGAFLCPKASETAWISKSNRSLERVQKQKNLLRFPSEPVFCLRKRFFVGKNAPKFF